MHFSFIHFHIVQSRLHETFLATVIRAVGRILESGRVGHL